MVHRMGDQLSDDERCQWQKANGKRCSQPRIDHDPTRRWCSWHEDQVLRRQRLFRAAEDVPEMSIEEHLSIDLRMSYVMVKELEFQVLDLGLAEDAWTIDTEETEEKTSEDPKLSYFSSKRARLHGAHPVVVQYLREREQYTAVIKMWIAAGFAARQVAIIERYVESLVESQMSLARQLGHDPNDPHVRAAIMETIRQQQASLSDLAPPSPKALEA